MKMFSHSLFHLLTRSAPLFLTLLSLRRRPFLPPDHLRERDKSATALEMTLPLGVQSRYPKVASLSKAKAAHVLGHRGDGEGKSPDGGIPASPPTSLG